MSELAFYWSLLCWPNFSKLPLYLCLYWKLWVFLSLNKLFTLFEVKANSWASYFRFASSNCFILLITIYLLKLCEFNCFILFLVPVTFFYLKILILNYGAIYLRIPNQSCYFINFWVNLTLILYSKVIFNTILFPSNTCLSYCQKNDFYHLIVHPKINWIYLYSIFFLSFKSSLLFHSHSYSQNFYATCCCFYRFQNIYFPSYFKGNDVR